jgi:imidazolonepropionase-like amidohydrolase
MSCAIALLSLTLAAQSAAPQDSEPKNSWMIFAPRVYTGEGVLEDQIVTVQDGKIRSITAGSSQADRSLNVAAITPGMIDLSVRLLDGWSGVEHKDELSPGMRAADAVDLFDERWSAVARSGVTSALVNPPDFDVIGGRGLVVKTAGGALGTARTLVEDAVLRGAIGAQPSMRNHPAFGRPEDLFSRRPTTRMGVEWEQRRAFYEAAALRGTPAAEEPGPSVLLAVLAGELPYFVQAWTTQDIRTTVYLKEELEREQLGTPTIVIDAAAEAWREPDLLVRSGVAVVLPPFPPQGRTGEGAFMTISCAKELVERGVPVALSAHGDTSAAASLGRQAGWAMRGGLTFEQALAAVTTTPARLLGLEDQLGTLAVGRAADLVLWSGPPFEASSAVIGVLVDGVLVLDPRPAQGDE